jgi:two-component system, LytTR family, response regulator
MRTIIVEDEEKSALALKGLLGDYGHGITVLECCESVDRAQLAIEKHQPDLVFLDVEMPVHNGFVLLERFRQPTFDVVFTTAYDHYAIRAIRHHAMDYLLKPIDPDELMQALDRVRHKRGQQNPQPDFSQLLASLTTLNRETKISVPTFDGLQMVDVKDIIKCSASESYTLMSLRNGKTLTISRLLKEYEELLAGFHFFRVHNSCLINLAHVVKYTKGEGGYVTMSNGESVEVSRRKKNELLGRLVLVRG